MNNQFSNDVVWIDQDLCVTSTFGFSGSHRVGNMLETHGFWIEFEESGSWTFPFLQ